MCPFKFAEDVDEYLMSSKDAFTSKVQANIESRDVLFTVLYEVLLLPGYFGFNWDALFDCLRDFHWTDKYLIVIIHDDLPALPEDELKIYLRILADSCLDWKADEEHKLEVVFPQSVRSKVEDLLSSDCSD